MYRRNYIHKQVCDLLMGCVNEIGILFRQTLISTFQHKLRTYHTGLYKCRTIIARNANTICA